MNPVLAITSRAVHNIAFALWLGGLIAIGAVVAPTTFHVMRTAPQLAGQLLAQRTLAGDIVGGSFRIFNVMTYACGILMLGCNLALGTSSKNSRPASRLTPTAMGLTALLLLSAIYLGAILFPALDSAKAQGNIGLFDILHQRYQQVTMAQMPLLIGIAILTGIRDTPSVTGSMPFKSPAA